MSDDTDDGAATEDGAATDDGAATEGEAATGDGPRGLADAAEDGRRTVPEEGFDADTPVDPRAEPDGEPVERPGEADREPLDATDAVSPIESDGYWERMLSDVASAADEHRRAGYRTVVLHPEASGTVADGEPGIAVVVPREEFDELDDAVSVRAVERYEVLRGEAPGRVHVLVQLYTADGNWAVLVPAAVDRDALTALRESVGGEFYTHVTPPESDATVSFTHDDPSLFFPDPAEGFT